MEVDSAIQTIAALSDTLNEARKLAWALPSKDVGGQVSLARELQTAAPALERYAAIGPRERRRELIQGHGLFAPLPAAVRRVLGLPVRPKPAPSNALAAAIIAQTQSLWQIVAQDFRAIALAPNGPSLATMNQELAWAQQCGDARGVYRAASQLFALRPYLQPADVAVQDEHRLPQLGAALVAAANLDQTLFEACAWGQKFFKAAAAAPAKGPSDCETLPHADAYVQAQHLRAVAALVQAHVSGDAPEARAGGRQQIDALVRLWHSMQAYLDVVTERSGKPHPHQELTPQLMAAAEALQTRRKAVAMCESLVSPLHLSPCFVAGKTQLLREEKAVANLALSDYDPLPEFAGRLLLELKACAQGERVARRNLVLVSAPGHGKSTLVSALLAQACTESRSQDGTWPRKVWVARAHAGDFLGHHFDESRAKIDAFFTRVHAEVEAHNGVAVVFIEEVDTLFARWNGEQQEDNRIKASFLQFTDNSVRAHPRVFVVGTTNHDEHIDPAIKSRFDWPRYTALNSVREKICRSLWPESFVDSPITLGGTFIPVTPLQLSMALAHVLPIRDLEAICCRVRQSHVISGEVKNLRLALFAFCEQAVAAIDSVAQNPHETPPFEGQTLTRRADVEATTLDITVPIQRIFAMAQASHQPHGPRLGFIVAYIDEQRLNLMFAAHGGLQIIGWDKEPMLTQAHTYKFDAHLSFGDDIADVQTPEASKSASRTLPVGSPSLHMLTLPLSDLTATLKSGRPLAQATLVLRIGLPPDSDDAACSQSDPFALFAKD